MLVGHLAHQVQVVPRVHPDRMVPVGLVIHQGQVVQMVLQELQVEQAHQDRQALQELVLQAQVDHLVLVAL